MTKIIIGRSRDSADFAIDNDTVSKTHATLTVQDGKLVLSDMDSTNGTLVLVNHRWTPITRQTVAASTPIKLGTFETTIQDILTACGVQLSSAQVGKKRPVSLYIRRDDGSYEKG